MQQLQLGIVSCNVRTIQVLCCDLFVTPEAVAATGVVPLPELALMEDTSSDVGEEFGKRNL